MVPPIVKFGVKETIGEVSNVGTKLVGRAVGLAVGFPEAGVGLRVGIAVGSVVGSAVDSREGAVASSSFKQCTSRSEIKDSE